jgi:hypothetical protein
MSKTAACGVGGREVALFAEDDDNVWHILTTANCKSGIFLLGLQMIAQGHFHNDVVASSKLNQCVCVCRLQFGNGVECKLSAAKLAVFCKLNTGYQRKPLLSAKPSDLGEQIYMHRDVPPYPRLILSKT